MPNKNFKSERIRLNLTQEEVAEKLGCTVKTLSIYEGGIRTPNGEFISAAADLFGCSTDYLLGRTDERTPHAA